MKVDSLEQLGAAFSQWRRQKRHRRDGRVRYFSVRECARLQTFPDDYVLRGVWSRCMRQLGNAVPVRLGEAVATSIKTQLEAIPNGVRQAG